MATVERLKDRGSLRGERWLALLAREFRAARLSRGLSQRVVARAVGISRPAYSAIELDRLRTLSVRLAAQIAAVLSLDLYVAVYPGAPGLRDDVSARLITRLRQSIGKPLVSRTEVPLPAKGDRPELRRWDLIAGGGGKRTAFECESRLNDTQAQLGHINIKRRDDAVDAFVLVLADTARNREVLNLYPDVFTDLPRLKTADVLAKLKAGQHPPTGLILLKVPPRPRSSTTPPTAPLPGSGTRPKSA